jgi:hypothetical protein
MAHGTCSVEDCERPALYVAKQLCNAHYTQQLRGKPFTTPREPIRWAGHVRPECSIDGCESLITSRGYCKQHYEQWKRNPAKAGQPIKRVVSRMRRDEQGRKECQKCEEWKPESAFAKQTRKGDGLQTVCRECRAGYYQRRALEIRDVMRLKRFGITREQFDSMFVAQDSMCAICGTTDPGSTYWCVDHNHACCPSSEKTCGKCIRGILCARCNQGIGHMGDDVARIRAAANYLEAANTRGV